MAGGHPLGAPSATGFTTYQPYTRVEFVDLNKQFWQKQGETLAVWLLQLWDTGVGPAPMGVLWILIERSPGKACEMPL